MKRLFLIIGITGAMVACDMTVDKSDTKDNANDYADEAAAVAPVSAEATDASDQTISQYIVRNEKLTRLARIFESTAEPRPLSEKGSYVFFAPSDRVLDNVADSTYEKLLYPGPGIQEQARKYINQHTLEQYMNTEQLAKAGDVTTVAGSSINVKGGSNGKIMVGGEYVTEVIQTSNGTIYVLDEQIVDFPSVQVPDSIQLKQDSLKTRNSQR